MLDPGPITLAVEGDLDEAVLRALIEGVGRTVGPVYGKQGKGQLLKNLAAYNNAARTAQWVILVDLDREEECPPPFVLKHLPAPAPGIRLRVAVRAIEAWILADAEHVGAFLGISPRVVPVEPEAELDPKQSVINMARRSRRRAIREDLVPASGSTARVGPAYTSRLIEFIAHPTTPWRPNVAARRSPSLRRCIQAIGSFAR